MRVDRYKCIPRLITACIIAVAILQLSLLKSFNEPEAPDDDVTNTGNIRTHSNTDKDIAEKATNVVESSKYVSLALDESEAAVTETKRETASDPISNSPEKVMIAKAIQVSHATSSNRYPDEYLAVKSYLKENSRTDDVRLLSFGSSYGNEAISLATLYFNENEGFTNVKIYGFDIDEETIEAAKRYVIEYENDEMNATHFNETDDDSLEETPDMQYEHLPIQFFDGRTTSLNVDGKYDAIFANSVLCDATSEPNTIDVVEAHFPFHDFESHLLSLDAVLKEGGLLAITNSNYNFSDSSLADRYEVIARCVGNFVPLIDLTRHVFVHRNPNVTDDCVWKKDRGI